MTRSLLFAAAMLFCLPALPGCGGSTETKTIQGNDMAAIAAEEAEAEAEAAAVPTEEPGGLNVQNNEP